MMLRSSRAFANQKRSALALSFAMILVLVIGAVTLMAPVDAEAMGPGGGGGRCGKCPCVDPFVLPDGTECYLDSCHLLFGYPECFWDCHYVCPFPG